MDIFFSTVIRRSPIAQGGELFRVDWETKKVLARISQNVSQSESDGQWSLFVRGMAPISDETFLVGFSPASIAEINVRTGTLTDLHQFSDDLAHAVHGICVWSPD